MRTLCLSVVLLASSTASAAPTVTMFGATWCGPCHLVRTFLSSHGIAFNFLDIDDERKRERFAKESGDEGGIPLTLIDKEKVRGANLKQIQTILERKGVRFTTATRAAGVELYGGQPASWWQQQFAELKQRVAALETKVRELNRVAVDDQERGVVLPRLRQDLKVLKASLDQFDIDASQVSLPRQYR